MNDVAERASALIEVDRPDEAARILTQALAQTPDDPELLDGLAVAQLQLDPKAACETAKRLIAIAPDVHRGHLLAALSYTVIGRGKDAAGHARAAVSAAPHLPTTHAVYARCISRQPRKRDEALAAARRAIELAPDSTIGYEAAGTVELHYGNWKQAERFYRQALAVDPSDRDAAVNLVIASEAGGKLAPALMDASALLRLDPRDVAARGVLDATVYTTLVHLTWVAVALLVLAGSIRGL